LLLFLFERHSDRQIKTHHETETETKYRDYPCARTQTPWSALIFTIQPKNRKWNISLAARRIPGNEAKFMQLEINIIQFDPRPYGRDTRFECHKCGPKLHVYAAI